MKLNKTKSFCIIALAAALSLTAWAAGNADRAYNNGYDAGHKAGVADQRAGHTAEFSRSLAYRRATSGYTTSLGSRQQYRTNFQTGFRDGYQDGYREAVGTTNTQAVPPPSRVSPARWANEAFSNGYQAGYTDGQRDAGGAYNASRSSVYQEATQGYDAARFPSLEDYQFNFRQGYETGYDDAYNGRPSNSRRDIHRTFGQTRRAGAGYGPARIIVPDGTVLHMRLNNTISTRSSQQGDRFTATVNEPVYAQGSDQVAIPVGSTVGGFLSHVQRPGKITGTAELQLRYETITLPGGPEYHLNATTAGIEDRQAGKVDEAEGTVKGKRSTEREIGTVAAGTALGAIIGGIAGGGKGAGIGAAVGAAVGVGGVLATHGGKDIDLPTGTPMEIRLNRPLELRR